MSTVNETLPGEDRLMEMMMLMICGIPVLRQRKWEWGASGGQRRSLIGGGGRPGYGTAMGGSTYQHSRCLRFNASIVLFLATGPRQSIEQPDRRNLLVVTPQGVVPCKRKPWHSAELRDAGHHHSVLATITL